MTYVSPQESAVIERGEFCVTVTQLEEEAFVSGTSLEAIMAVVIGLKSPPRRLVYNCAWARDGVVRQARCETLDQLVALLRVEQP